MNTRRYIIASICVFVFVFVFEFIVHAILLMGVYEETAHLWRPQGGIYMLFMTLSQLSFAFVMAFIFTRHFENKGIKEGVRFGLYMGLLLATPEIGTYCYMPIPLYLTIAWVLAAIGKGVGSGIVLSRVYRSSQ